MEYIDKILTNNGFISSSLLNELNMPILFDKDGNQFNNFSISEQSYSCKKYKITFNDYTTIYCNENDKLIFQIRKQFGTNNWKEDTIKHLLNYKIITGKNNYNIAIPICKPIKFDKKELFLHPYLLGALLGDGGFSQRLITFTNTENDVITKVNKYVSTFGQFRHRKNENHIQRYFVGGKKNEFRDYIHNTFGFCKSNTKFIPEEYKLSSIDDRYELINGLIDTDGTVDSHGNISFSSTSKQLIDDTIFVIRSLGYRTFIDIDNRKNISYRIHIKDSDSKLFSSNKHMDKFIKYKPAKRNFHQMKIISIDEIDDYDCKTINTDMHYIGDNFIVR